MKMRELDYPFNAEEIIKKKKTTINARVINENVARFLSSSCFINTLL